MNLNELQMIQEALEKLSTALDCSTDEILSCLVGVLISVEEADEIRLSLL